MEKNHIFKKIIKKNVFSYDDKKGGYNNGFQFNVKATALQQIMIIVICMNLMFHSSHIAFKLTKVKDHHIRITI